MSILGHLILQWDLYLAVISTIIDAILFCVTANTLLKRLKIPVVFWDFFSNLFGKSRDFHHHIFCKSSDKKFISWVCFWVLFFFLVCCLFVLMGYLSYGNMFSINPLTKKEQKIQFIVQLCLKQVSSKQIHACFKLSPVWLWAANVDVLCIMWII